MSSGLSNDVIDGYMARMWPLYIWPVWRGLKLNAKLYRTISPPVPCQAAGTSCLEGLKLSAKVFKS